jgi:predicted N-acetyltransferase YhbS
MTLIEAEPPDCDPAVTELYDRVFGQGWRHKPCHALRRGRAPSRGISLIARTRRRLLGAVRFWPTLIGRTPALMLGPLAVDPDSRARGLGADLVREGLAQARRQGHRAIWLVGDAPYYARFGFERARMDKAAFAGPVDGARLLGLELVSGALARADGPLVAAA